MSAAPVIGTPGADASGDRGALSKLRSLVVLSQLMMESSSERQILQLALGAARSLAPCGLVGVCLDDGSWFPDGQRPIVLDALGEPGGAVVAQGWAWACAYPLRSFKGRPSYLVAGGAAEPSEEEQFLLRALAQQTGAAVANRRLHEQEQRALTDLAAANAAVQETLAALQHSVAVHERLTRVAASGDGFEGIARAVHEVTGMPVAIEDRYGNLRAWAGPFQPDPYPKDPAARREQLLRRGLREGRPIRDGGRVVAVTQPQHDIVGVIVLVDPGATAGEQQLMALEHGTTVLAMELTRLRSLAETELRLRRDLVEGLLAGTGTENALWRAEALSYDLQRPHRVVIAEGRGRKRDDEAFLHAVRRAARDEPAGSLLLARGDRVVLLADRDCDWEHLRTGILRELGGGRCRLGIGERCDTVEEFPRSLRQAELALHVQRSAAALHDRATTYDELGVYQLLAEIGDPQASERFARRWLGPLLDYDERRGSDLVATLSHYLECGGNYEATAGALFIHRSTLKYRLQRIREMTGYDLTNPDTRFNLQLAARAWATLGHLRD